MPERRRADRLARDEVLCLQQKARREWLASDWLARNEPRKYLALEEENPSETRIDLSGGTGAAAQEAGYVVVGASRPATRHASGDDRQVDLVWDLERACLPFEARTVDRYALPRAVWRALGLPARQALPREMARTLVVGGTVRLTGAGTDFGDLLTAAGFTPVGDEWVLSRQTLPLEEASPLTIDDRVLGEPRIPYLRQPVP